jgi:hypothetical protein
MHVLLPVLQHPMRMREHGNCNAARHSKEIYPTSDKNKQLLCIIQQQVFLQISLVCTNATSFQNHFSARAFIMELSRIILALLIIVIIRGLLNKIKVKVAASRTSQSHGCAEPQALPSLDPIFGLDTVSQTFREMKENRRMKSVYELVQRYGHTYQSFPFGRRSVSTIHPQNLHVVFTENDKFGVGRLRERASIPMIGRGIVSSDGAVWAHARTMIKPTLNRSEIVDRGMFSTHMEKFLQLLPSDDNSVIDLQSLFDRLVSCSLPLRRKALTWRC